MAKTEPATSPVVALKIIRTWAAVQMERPTYNVLVPEDVVRLCDKALKHTTGGDDGRGE